MKSTIQSRNNISIKASPKLFLGVITIRIIPMKSIIAKQMIIIDNTLMLVFYH